MLRALLTLIMILALPGCKASFKNIKDDKLVSSDDNLEIPNDTEPPLPCTGPDCAGATDNKPYQTLNNETRLSPEESAAHGCKGILIVRESGLDRNRDTKLQPIEVNNITTECIPNPGKPNQNCPNQTGAGCGAPSQNLPGQSGR